MMNVTFTSNETSILLNGKVIATMPEADMAADAAKKMNFLCMNGMPGASIVLAQMLEGNDTYTYDGNIPQLAAVSLMGGSGVELDFLTGIDKDGVITFNIGRKLSEDSFEAFDMDGLVFGETFMTIQHFQGVEDPVPAQLMDGGYGLLSGLLKRTNPDFKHMPRHLNMSATAVAYVMKDEMGDGLSQEYKEFLDLWKKEVEIHEWEMDEEDTSLRSCELTGITDVIAKVMYFNRD